MSEKTSPISTLPQTRLTRDDIARLKASNTQKLTISEIIAMAWDDETSFDSIERISGMAEKDVIALMRAQLKRSSFKMWRERVAGRKAKHEIKMRVPSRQVV